jgi:hypothetical protein
LPDRVAAAEQTGQAVQEFLIALVLTFADHPDNDRPREAILLEVDQEFVEGPRPWVAQYSPIIPVRSKSASIGT